MTTVKHWLRRCLGICSLAGLFFASGCVTTLYKPSDAVLYPKPAAIRSAVRLGLACDIGEFESGHLTNIDVKNNVDAFYNCSILGQKLREELVEQLRNAGRFARVTAAEESGDIRVTGRIENLTVTNNWGKSTSATSSVTYSVRLGNSRDARTIKNTVHATATYPGGGNFHCAIDAVRMELEHKIAKNLCESTEIAAVSPSQPRLLAEAARETPIPLVPIAGQWAIVVGIAEYENAGKNGLTQLAYADDDARAFAKALEQQGWSRSHIKLFVNEQATERNVRITMESWLTKAGHDDFIVLFWSGHGFPDPENPEKVYFACYETDIGVPATGFRMDRLRDILSERQARNVVVLADTCHAGKLITRGGKGLSILPNLEKMKREEQVPKGWIFMVSADTDRQAIEHASWSNGAFTHCLLKGLSGDADGFESAGTQDGQVTMGELRGYLRSVMPDQTQKVLGVAKHPVITTSTGDPNIWQLTLSVKQ